LLRRYVDAIRKTAPWANGHPELIDVTAKYAGIARYPAEDILYRVR
jgi:hypothetical protein